jgi:glutamine amidotransferase
MCRFLAYLGQPVLMDDLLFKPRNSLIKQSIRAHETDEPLNGDGFGVGWYIKDLDPAPALFVSVRPAWNDRNLLYMAPKIKSDCIFAHVRAASTGMVSEFNCHPFHFKNFLFMHNGDIGGFELINRELREQLSDEVYDSIKGQTDSEHLFALFVDVFEKHKCKLNAEGIAKALEETISLIHQMRKKHGVTSPTLINAAVTDGRSMVAVRYVSSMRLKSPTLYYSQGTAYECLDGICRMKRNVEERAVLIVSEKLTNYRSDWKQIPVNHILLVDEKLKTELRAVRKFTAPKPVPGAK